MHRNTVQSNSRHSGSRFSTVVGQSGSSARCIRQIWKVGKVGKVVKVGKVGKVGKEGKVRFNHAHMESAVIARPL